MDSRGADSFPQVVAAVVIGFVEFEFSSAQREYTAVLVFQCHDYPKWVHSLGFCEIRLGYRDVVAVDLEIDLFAEGADPGYVRFDLDIGVV